MNCLHFLRLLIFFALFLSLGEHQQRTSFLPIEGQWFWQKQNPTEDEETIDFLGFNGKREPIISISRNSGETEMCNCVRVMRVHCHHSQKSFIF